MEKKIGKWTHNSVVQAGGKQNKPMRQARTSCPSIRAKKFLEDHNTSNNKQKVIGNCMIHLRKGLEKAKGFQKQIT